VLIGLSSVLLVPIPAFQSMPAGMMLSVGFVLLAALTLLPTRQTARMRPTDEVRSWSRPWWAASAS
jgi:RND superfamily putative drug exporter